VIEAEFGTEHHRAADAFGGIQRVTRTKVELAFRENQRGTDSPDDVKIARRPHAIGKVDERNSFVHSVVFAIERHRAADRSVAGSSALDRELF
jgi:hypothetical protein